MDRPNHTTPNKSGAHEDESPRTLRAKRLLSREAIARAGGEQFVMIAPDTVNSRLFRVVDPPGDPTLYGTIRALAESTGLDRRVFEREARIKPGTTLLVDQPGVPENRQRLHPYGEELRALVEARTGLPVVGPDGIYVPYEGAPEDEQLYTAETLGEILGLTPKQRRHLRGEESVAGLRQGGQKVGLYARSTGTRIRDSLQ